MARRCDKCIHWVKHPNPSPFPMACQLRINAGTIGPGVRPSEKVDCGHFQGKTQMPEPWFSLEEILECSK